MEGRGDVPIDWLISRVCEEFHCLPSQAVAELMDHDEMVLDVMESRAYARTKEAIDRATKESEMPTGPMVNFVFAVQAELLRRRREQSKNLNVRW